jgi:hypothetical protein
VTRSVRTLVVAAIALAAAVACSQPAQDVRVAWQLQPASPAAGTPATVRMTLARGGEMVPGARLRLEGHMSHPGMTPIVTDVTEIGDGVYEARLKFSMVGDWVLVLAGSLPDGTRVTAHHDVPDVAAAE